MPFPHTYSQLSATEGWRALLHRHPVRTSGSEYGHSRASISAPGTSSLPKEHIVACGARAPRRVTASDRKWVMGNGTKMHKRQMTSLGIIATCTTYLTIVSCEKERGRLTHRSVNQRHGARRPEISKGPRPGWIQQISLCTTSKIRASQDHSLKSSAVTYCKSTTCFARASSSLRG